MPKITKTYSHSLGKDEAARRLRERISTEKLSKANLVSVTKEVWNDPHHLDYSMTIFNHRIDGNLQITDDKVVVDLNLPFVAMMVKGMIENQMDQQMQIMLTND